MKNLNFFIFFLFLQHLTAQTPRQVLDLIPGTASTFNDIQDELRIGVGNRALFVVYRQFKYELWSSDGSEAGTSMLMVGTNGEDYPEFLPYDGKQVLFVADRNNGNRTGGELWITDGTVANTRKLFSNASRFIRKARVHQGQIFYVSASATEFFDQTELWRYNPATSENQMLARYKGPDGILDVVPFSNQLILLAQSKDSTYQLIKSDGTVAGTQVFHTLKNDGALGAYPFMTATEQQVFFFFHGSRQAQLFRNQVRDYDAELRSKCSAGQAIGYASASPCSNCCVLPEFLPALLALNAPTPPASTYPVRLSYSIPGMAAGSSTTISVYNGTNNPDLWNKGLK